MNATFHFRNQALADLWNGGARGYGGLTRQISDGMWENTPNTGWREYCSAEVVVDGTTKLENMPHSRVKTSFGFTRLISFVGDDLLELVRATEPGATMKTLRSYLQEISKAVKNQNEDN